MSRQFAKESVLILPDDPATFFKHERAIAFVLRVKAVKFL